MKEPKRIKLSPETPTPKDTTKYRLLPIDKAEWDITGQDNDDVYVPSDLNKVNYEDNSKND
jgi:hypothetical protein